MKKLIKILILTIFMFSFFLIYKEFENKNSLEIKNIENKLENSYDILIPSNITELPRSDQYNLLADVSENALSSIFFTRIDRIDGKEKIIKYIYTMDNKYMDSVNIRKGKKLDKTLMNSEFFISTEDTNDPNQIGVIDNINDDFVLEIRTLNSMLKDGMHFTGICTVNLPTDNSVDFYMKKIETLFGVENISFNKAGIIGEKYNTNYTYIILVTLILLFILVYKYISLYKEFGIKKLLGYSIYDIYKEEIKSLIKIILISGLISIIFMSMIFIDIYSKLYFEFIIKLIIIYLIISLLIIGVVLIIINLIYQIRIIDFIKNKNLNTNILRFNLIMKSILILIIIGIITTNVNIFKASNEKFEKSFNKWNNFNDYIVLNLDDLNFDIAESEQFINGQQKIYEKFNKEGAIFAAFGNYEEMNLEQNKNVEYYKKTGIVNPNYLKANPIYDIDGNKVEISEKNKDWIVLIPEMFKVDENIIYDYYNKWISTFNKNSVGKIKIIWVKSDQKYFTYNINVNPKGNNYVTNPIVMVGTENGLFPGWNNAVFNVQGNPLKIKIESKENLYEQFIPIIESAGINASSLRINFANEEVLSKINEYKTIFYTLTLTILIALVLVLVIIIQNAWNFFEQNKLEIAIKTFNGYSNFNKYIEYFKITIINYIIIFILGILLKISIYKILITLLIISFLIETIITIIILELNNRKEIISTLKGEY